MDEEKETKAAEAIADLTEVVANLTKVVADLTSELLLVKLTLDCTINAISRREFTKNVRHILENHHLPDSDKERLIAFTRVKEKQSFLRWIFGF